VYPELRRLDQSRMRRERNDHTLEPTALVHEVYLQLAKQGELQWRNRAHFLAVASEAMRRILVDYARAHNAGKRGGESAKVELTYAEGLGREPFTVVLEIHHLLEELARTDERMSKIVELRYFGGLSHDEVGEVLGTSTRTVKRDWEVARAWLYTRMHRGRPSDAGTVATAQGNL
jgi:RNA polymerase sigma factor (TIGR02999 family)